MHISPPLLLLTLITLFTPSLTQSTTNNNTYNVRCLEFPPMVIGNATFNPTAITSLSDALAKNTFNPPLPSTGIHISPGFASSVGYSADGGYQVCLQNFYLFKSLTVALGDVSDVVKSIKQTCCGTENNKPGQPGRQGKCQDSKASVKATDGSVVQVVGQVYGDRCCGMWGCSSGPVM